MNFPGNCRMCSESLGWWVWTSNPFSSKGASASKEKSKEDKEKDEEKKKSQRDVSTYQHRSDEDIEELIQKWERYAHPRARDFFPTQEELFSVLRQLAIGVHKTEDPILNEDSCVYWYGDVTKEDIQAAIRMVKPGEMQESVTFVNRVLAFIFATDESFEQLMKLPKEPFRMVCGDQLCVSLCHISMDVDKE